MKCDVVLYCISDINECDSDTDNCHDDAQCTNTLGRYICQCKVGYTGDGLQCEGQYNYIKLNVEFDLVEETFFIG